MPDRPVEKLLVVTTIVRTLEAFLTPYSKAMRSRGWQVDCLANGADQSEICRRSFSNCYGIKWTRSPIHLRALFRSVRLLSDLVNQNGYDIVHVHTPIAAFCTRFALRKLRRQGAVKVVYTAHGFHFYKGNSAIKNAIFFGLEKMAARWTDEIVVINQEDLQSAIRLTEGTNCNSRYMPGIGVDLVGISQQAEQCDLAALREELKLRPADRVVLMIAEFNPGKGHRDALEAFASINTREVVLVLAGSGAEFNQMSNYAKVLGISERVRFLGFRTDIPALCKLADICLLPSKREGLPRSVMEAMVLGLPVVGYAIRGMSDLVGQCGGKLVEVGNVQALSKALVMVLSDETLREQLSEQARDHSALFDTTTVLALHDQLYAELIGRVVDD